MPVKLRAGMRSSSMLTTPPRMLQTIVSPGNSSHSFVAPAFSLRFQIFQLPVRSRSHRACRVWSSAVPVWRAALAPKGLRVGTGARELRDGASSCGPQQVATVVLPVSAGLGQTWWFFIGCE